MSADKPHKAVILFNLEVHGVKDTGECDGRTLTREDLEQFGLKHKFTRTVNGFDKHECLRKLKELLDQFESK